MTNEEIATKAIKFATANKKRIAKELTDPNKFKPDELPVSIFMAGSPGAGKTEFSKSLIKILERRRLKENRIIRIDSDDIRQYIPGYTGDNSYLFQGAVSLVVEKIHDLVLHQKQNFIFDGTLAKYDKAVENIKRSLDRKRSVFIFYLYQKPEIAWKFTRIREKVENRNIPKSAFIEQFFGAKNTINLLQTNFGEKIVIFLVKKDFEKNTVENLVEMEPSKCIDNYIKDSYTNECLEKIL